MEDRKLNEKESLELIARMIQNTRRNLDAGSGNMFLIWGYVCALVTLDIWVGIYFTDNQVWLWGFWAIPVLGWLLSWRLLRKRRLEERVKDYGSRTLMMLWIYMGVICFIVASYATVYQRYEMILPLCGLVTSIGSLATGIFVRYKNWALPGCGVGVAVALIAIMEEVDPLYAFALVAIFSLIIPGHALNRMARKEAKEVSHV